MITHSLSSAFAPWKPISANVVGPGGLGLSCAGGCGVAATPLGILPVAGLAVLLPIPTGESVLGGLNEGEGDDEVDGGAELKPGSASEYRFRPGICWGCPLAGACIG